MQLENDRHAQPEGRAETRGSTIDLNKPAHFLGFACFAYTMVVPHGEHLRLMDFDALGVLSRVEQGGPYLLEGRVRAHDAHPTDPRAGDSKSHIRELFHEPTDDLAWEVFVVSTTEHAKRLRSHFLDIVRVDGSGADVADAMQQFDWCHPLGDTDE